METKKKLPLWGWALVLAGVVLLGVLLAKPGWYAWRAITYAWGEPTAAEKQVWEYAREQGVPYGIYPQSLIDLLDRNPETEDFVLGYPNRQQQDYDLSTFAYGAGVPLFLQWDSRWGYEKYGSDCMAITGCGPTCLAMAGFYLTGDPGFDPAQVARFAQKNGYYAEGYGSSWTLISQGGPELGLTVTELPLVKKKITDALEAGCPVILAMGPGDFTTTGHYIVLTAYCDGVFKVNDPNSRINSEKTWTYEELEGQIRNIWKIEA